MNIFQFRGHLTGLKLRFFFIMKNDSIAVFVFRSFLVHASDKLFTIDFFVAVLYQRPWKEKGQRTINQKIVRVSNKGRSIYLWRVVGKTIIPFSFQVFETDNFGTCFWISFGDFWSLTRLGFVRVQAIGKWIMKKKLKWNTSSWIGSAGEFQNLKVNVEMVSKIKN